MNGTEGSLLGMQLRDQRGSRGVRSKLRADVHAVADERVKVAGSGSQIQHL